MGRVGAGVEVREKSIRFTFIEGKPTLMVNGEPAPPTPANVRWAHRLAAEMRSKLAFGTFSLQEYFPLHGTAGAPTTVAMQLDTWLAGQRIKASTRAGYESAIKFWKAAACTEKDDALGDRALRGAKLSEILFALGTKPNLNGKTVNNYVDVLRGAFALALADKVLTENIVERVPRASRQKKPADPFSLAEADAIIEDMRTHYPQPIWNLVEWWFFTGVRTSEMAGLHWAKTDLFSRNFVVDEALVRGVEEDTTKTQRERTVMLNSRALAALTRQKAHTYLKGEHVWLDSRYGTPWTEERAFRRSYWTPTLKRLGIRYRRPYAMRHTYATAMLMAGMTPAFCAGQLGHSVDIFLGTYAKWLPGAGDITEMNKLEQSMKGTGT